MKTKGVAEGWIENEKLNEDNHFMTGGQWVASIIGGFVLFLVLVAWYEIFITERWTFSFFVILGG